MVDGIITSAFSLWVLLAVMGPPPFQNQQDKFMRIFSKNIWITVFSIILLYGLFSIFKAIR